ncbi:MAG: cell division protein [Brevundimonas sp.]|uniref:cell division protein FtsL n=1 Tax=Brevundimonas sp. TaxID=1871086 RepID=UPI0017901B18|nr:cell division protein [Brevundimonas sp.]MBA4803955.1 cell division protein [Brevundimonas sp.]
MSLLVLPLQRLFAWKIRGVRWVEIIGVLLVAAMIFSVYVAKAAAARTGSEIADLERQIAENGRRVRLLRAEAARLERPVRLEALSRDAGLVPVDVHRLATEDRLPTLAPRPEPAPAPTPAPAVAAPEAPVAAEAAPATDEAAR